MAIFLIERNFAEQLDLSADDVREVNNLNDEMGMKWLFSFLSADQKKTYCLYEAKDADALREQARALGVPADVIVEVSKLDPEAILAQA